MNRKAEISLNSLVFGLVICFGLFFAVIGGSINLLGTNYDTSGVNQADLNSSGFNHLSSLSNRINDSKTGVENVVVEPKWYDWFAGLWNNVRSSLTFVAKSYTTLIDVSDQSVSRLKLMPEFKAAITTIIIMLVVFGLLLARYMLGRK